MVQNWKFENESILPESPVSVIIIGRPNLGTN